MTSSRAIVLSVGLVCLCFGCAKPIAHTNTDQNKWRGQDLCNYMIEKLPAGTYKADGAGYSCGSMDKDIGGGSKPANTLSYYVRGDADRGREMGLILKVNDPKNSGTANKALADHSEELQMKALGIPLSGGAARAIMSGHAGKGKVGETPVAIKRNELPGGGYELHYVIIAP